MNVDNLVRMANQIGEFFQSMPDHAEAVDDVADHIRKFWEPRMRREIYAHLDGPAGDDLLPIVAEALRAHRERLGC